MTIKATKDLSTFDFVVLGLATFIFIMAIGFSGVFVQTGLFIGLGTVLGVAIAIHKFPIFRRIVVYFDRWFDLLLLIGGFWAASSPEGIVGAVFAAVAVSGYLVIAKMVYKNDKPLFKKKTKGAKT